MRLTASPTERTTAATDGVLSLAAVGGLALLQLPQTPPSWKIQLWCWAFALVALAAALGAGYHGLVLRARLRGALWQVLTVCLSAAISLVAAGVVHDASGAEAARRSLPVLLAAGTLIYAASRFFAGLFVVFLAYQALALALALGAYVWMALRGTPAGAGWMAAGAAVSLVAAGAQTRRSLRVRWIWEFDRNGVYHLVQALGIVLFGVGLSRG
jgi:hypothetical protein